MYHLKIVPFWNTSGFIRNFDSILQYSLIKHIINLVVVVDLSDEGSLEMAGTWKRDILNNCMVSVDDTSSGDNTRMSVASQVQLPILLIGNKLDKVGFVVELVYFPCLVYCDVFLLCGKYVFLLLICRYQQNLMTTLITLKLMMRKQKFQF